MSAENERATPAPARTGPWIEVEEVVAQLYSDAPAGTIALPFAADAPSTAQAALRRQHQHEARRAERAASRLLQVFAATTCFLRELRRGLRQTQPETAPVPEAAPAAPAAPEAPTSGGPVASSSAPIVSSAILMCWSVVLLRFGHTKTAGAFAAAGGVVAWVALLARRA